jgi:hypothetical protein
MGPGVPAHPGMYPYPPPQPMPPNAPRTLGLLSIVFGAVCAAQSLFGVLGGGAGLAGMMTKMMPGNVDMSAMTTYLNDIRGVMMVQSLGFLLMSGWLIFLGVGQRGYRAWAARQSVIWGALGLAFLVVVVIMNLAVVGPAAGRMFESLTRHSQLPMSPMFMKISSLFGIAFYVPFPIILITTFRKPAIRSAMVA